MSERKLVGTNEMFKKALAGGYAIGAYNVNNMEILQGIAEAAEETQSPIILQVSAGARKYANQTYLIKLVEAALATTTVPIALHLDHGADFEICKACIDGGFSSVMIDGSRFPLEENIKLTKQVVMLTLAEFQLKLNSVNSQVLKMMLKFTLKIQLTLILKKLQDLLKKQAVILWL